jgi:F-type H+-transporting ATPase subunit c
MFMYKSAKVIGAGIAALSLGGAGVGIGLVFSSLLSSVAINPNVTKQLFSYAILGFALTEAIALFGLMVTFLILFGM